MAVHPTGSSLEVRRTRLFACQRGEKQGTQMTEWLGRDECFGSTLAQASEYAASSTSRLGSNSDWSARSPETCRRAAQLTTNGDAETCPVGLNQGRAPCSQPPHFCVFLFLFALRLTNPLLMDWGDANDRTACDHTTMGWDKSEWKTRRW